MVDQHLLDKFKIMRKHPESTGYDASFVLFELFKQLSIENDVLKKNIEEWDLCLQFVILEDDKEVYKYWSSIRDGRVDFGEGDGPSVTTTLKASRDIFGGLLTREVDIEDAYKAGDIKIKGRSRDILMYGEALLFVGKLIDELLK